MAAKKSLSRARFLEELEAIKPTLPKTYSTLVFSKIRKPAVLARVKDPAVLAKLATPETAGVYFNRVMKAQAVDFVVLDVLKEIAEEYRSARPQPVAA